MTKAKQKKIMKRFEGKKLCITRVEKFFNFLVPKYSDLNQCYNDYPSYSVPHNASYDAMLNAMLFERCKELVNKVCAIVGAKNIISYGINSYNDNTKRFTYVINFTYQDKKYSYYLENNDNTLYAEEE